MPLRRRIRSCALGRGQRLGVAAHAKNGSEQFQDGPQDDQALVYALLYAQGILPKYTLDPVAATTRRAAPRLTSAKQLAPRRTAPKRAARKAPARKARRRKRAR